MRPYSVDLRERVVARYGRGEQTAKEVAQVFGIGEATLHRWQRRQQETGSVAPAPHGGGNPARVGEEPWDLVRTLVAEQPDRTIEEVAEVFTQRTERRVSRAAMGRTLLRLGLTRKKSR